MKSQSISRSSSASWSVLRLLLLVALSLVFLPRTQATTDLRVLKELTDFTSKLTDKIYTAQAISDSDLQKACDVVTHLLDDKGFRSELEKIASANKRRTSKNQEIKEDFVGFIDQFLRPEAEALKKSGLNDLQVQRILVVATSVRQEINLDFDSTAILKSAQNFRDALCNAAKKAKDATDQAKQGRLYWAIGKGLAGVVLAGVDASSFVATAGSVTPLSAISALAAGALFTQSVSELQELGK